MQFTLEKTDHYAVIRLQEQKLNTLIAAALKSELLLLNTQGFNNIILDLSLSQYCDSSGLSAILVGNRLCRNAGGAFVICSLSEAVMKLVQISQLDQVLLICKSFPEALEFVSSDKVEGNVGKD